MGRRKSFDNEPAFLQAMYTSDAVRDLLFSQDQGRRTKAARIIADAFILKSKFPRPEETDANFAIRRGKETSRTKRLNMEKIPAESPEQFAARMSDIREVCIPCILVLCSISFLPAGCELGESAEREQDRLP